jgi:hypothetical protein
MEETMTQILIIILPALLFGAFIGYICYEAGYAKGYEDGKYSAHLGEIVANQKIKNHKANKEIENVHTKSKHQKT